MKFKKFDKEGIFKSLFAAYFVILLHVFLLAGTGVTVVLFRGVYHYLPWIMAGLVLLIIALFWLFYFRIKKSSQDLKDLMSFPEFRHRNLEIKLLGGMASVKINGAENHPDYSHSLLSHDSPMAMLEESSGIENSSLTELADLYEKGLLSPEEFEAAKKKILY